VYVGRSVLFSSCSHLPRTAEAEADQGSREGQEAANSGVGAPRTERGGVCLCGRVHARRGTSDRGGLTRVQHAARGSFQCRPALHPSPCDGCPVQGDHAARHRFLHSSRGVSEHEAFLSRRRARRQARAGASSTDLSPGFSSGLLNDHGNCNGEASRWIGDHEDTENRPSTHVHENNATEIEKQELLQSLQQMRAMSRELPRLRLREKRVRPEDSDEESTVGKGCTMNDVRRFRKRIESATNALPCASCGVIPDPTHHVSLPFASGTNMREMTDSERKTATLLEPLTMDRRDDGTFDPGTYSTYWIYTDAVCQVTDTICLCIPCRVCLGKRQFRKYSKRNGFDMFDHYPDELAILNPLETALVSIIIPTNRRHHYQQTHAVGQTLTFWNSTQSVAQSLPRAPNDSSILLLTDEHGKSVLDDTPLWAAAIASALKYLKENDEQYETVAINTESMHALERTLCPFLTERDPESRDEEGMNSSEAPPVGGSSPQGTRDTVLRTPCVPREQPLPPADGQPTTTDDVESALRDEQPRCIQRNRFNPAWVADTETPMCIRCWG